ncbi:pyridoxal phosphate-dependent aminotransferase [Streptomyces sp. NPDC057555]|uniref:pyridoxal phosphate-dependent aminotransferase n=1 Tax=Streptomyces sp. NPDC057555 TaxID=3346166 RepID=UPI0036B8F28C
MAPLSRSHEAPGGTTEAVRKGLHTHDGQPLHELLAQLARTADPERRIALYQRLVPDALNLATAENVLLYQSLRDNIFSKVETLSEKDVRYAPAYGSDELRKEIAALLRPTLSPDLKYEHIYGTSGVSAALECIAFALKAAGVLTTGDRVLLPAPHWQGFIWCFEERPGLVCVPAPMTTKPVEDFQLTLADLQNAYRQQPEPPKLLVLTNPNNPLGVNYSKELLESIYTWALKETGMHIISDEMYAHSQITGATPDFVSALRLDAVTQNPQARERVHLVWGFAKDFGLSGFKAGLVISAAEAVRKAMEGDTKLVHPIEPYSWFSPFDSLKHFYLGALLTAGANRESYARTLMQKDYPGHLTTAFRSVSQALEKNQIPYVYREGQNTAQFIWLDLTQYLRTPKTEIPPELGVHYPLPGELPNGLPAESGKAEPLSLPLLFSEISSAEEYLRDYLAKRAAVLLLPGQTLNCPKPGYFRLCFTAFHTEDVVDAINRLGEALREIPPHSGD